MDILSAAQDIEALTHEYYKLVFHTIYGLTGNWEESQDLTQDTFQQALKSIDAARLASGTQFHAKAWLLRIALNTVRMQRRRRNIFRFIPFSSMQERKVQESNDNHFETLNEQAAPVQPGGYGAVEAEDLATAIAERDAVQRALTRVPEILRTCLLLSIVAGLSVSEIGRLLDLKDDAVRQRLGRARKQFKQAYEYESGEEIQDSLTTKKTHAQQFTQERTESQTLPDSSRRLMQVIYPPAMGSNYV